MAGYLSVIGASVGGVVLMCYLTWTYLGYEYIPHLVSIEEAAGKQYDYIIGQFKMCLFCFNPNIAFGVDLTQIVK